MRVWWGIVAAMVVSCGRISFDNLRPVDGDGGGDGNDGANVDVSTACGASAQMPQGICASLVSSYLFDDSANLGSDSSGPNHMVDMVSGTPQQSTDVPPGLTGHSLLLDGASSFCIATGFTFDSTQDHTLCWWAKPTVFAPGDNGDMFAQFCAYDTWSSNTGTSFRWTINNCSSTGTQSHFVVPSIFTLGQWVQICQTFESATMTRRVTIANQSYSTVDVDPIDDPTQRWCMGSFGGAGFFTGLIYRPMWFDRVLSDPEIQEIYANRCCVP